MTKSNTPQAALTIAATDSGGGAGVAADLRSLAAHGVHGTLAVTAVTAQDTVGLRSLFLLPAQLVADQIDAVTADIAPRSCKTGMLGSPETLEVVLERVASGALPPALVVDPVLVSSSDAPLFPPDQMASLVAGYRTLLRSSTVVTPNLPEAALLSGRRVGTLSDMEAAARDLHELGPSLVVVKGGRLRGFGAGTDIAFDGAAVSHLSGPFVKTRNVHGTGCSFSAAIAALLALGSDPLRAAIAAKRFVREATARSADWRLGEGHGPIDHLDLPARRAEAEQRLAGVSQGAAAGTEGGP